MRRRRERGRRDRGRRDCHHQGGQDEGCSLHVDCSSPVPIGAGTLISKIATARVFPFTITSPRGRMSYAWVSLARVASLMIIRVLYSLFKDSSRDPRFTLSPMTV